MALNASFHNASDISSTKASSIFICKSRSGMHKVLSLVLLLFMTMTVVGCSVDNSSDSHEIPLAATGAEEATLSVEIGRPGQAPVEEIALSIVGKTSDGSDVDDVVMVPLGKRFQLDCSLGAYTFSFDSFTSKDEKQVYKGNSAIYTFDGKSDKVVTLSLELDEDETSKLAKAAEAVKTARAEAEARAQAEAAAAAQREAEEKAQAEAAAAEAAKAQANANQSQSISNERTVYVASSGNGKKYHSNPNCSKMKGTREMTVSEAKSAGYTACSKCSY